MRHTYKNHREKKIERTGTPGIYTCWRKDISIKDFRAVGGKNAARGELHQCLKKENTPIPQGFAVTANAYSDFLTADAMLAEKRWVAKAEKGVTA